MKTDKQITTIATNTLLNYFNDCDAVEPVRKIHCMTYLQEAMVPFNALCKEHAQGRDSKNSVVARKALMQINKILFPLVVDDTNKNH